MKARKPKTEGESRFRVRIGGHHVLVMATHMKEVRKAVRDSHGVFLFFHGNSAFSIKKIK